MRCGKVLTIMYRITAPGSHAGEKGVTCRQAFYISLPILHGLSAIAALVICFQCNVGPMAHQARVPRASGAGVGGLFNVSRVKGFLAAYHWAEDGEFDTHKWNPFALAMVFQWLTAGFALRTIAPLAQDGVVAIVWYAWLLTGYCVFLVWSLVESEAMCIAMFATVTVSFIAAAVICLLSLGPPRFNFSTQAANYAVLTPSHEPGHKGAAQGDSQLAYTDGRKWVIPRRIKGLKQPTHIQGEALAGVQGDTSTDQMEGEQVWGVFFRYAEYCVTAPLLFIAVVCLLVVDAPAWMFLSGYWLVLACNLYGLPLHYNFLILKSKVQHHGKGWWGTVSTLFFAGPWGDRDSGLWYYLQGAWVAILIPMSGLVYLTRMVLLNSDIPVLVLFMIWNLLISYLMFGIVPTFVYITGKGKRQLPWLLDILNIAAKFPLPIVIILGFITRPVTFRPCIS